MLSTIVSALPTGVSAPVTAVLAVIDGRLLFGVLGVCIVLITAAIVRSGLTRRHDRGPSIRIATRGDRPQRAA
jgi:hypothetical protein